MGAIQLKQKKKKKNGLEKNKRESSGLLLKIWCFSNAQVMSVKYNKRCREFVLRKTLIFCKHISKKYLSETHNAHAREKFMQFSTKKRTVWKTKDLSWQLSPQKKTSDQGKFALSQSPRSTQLKKERFLQKHKHTDFVLCDCLKWSACIFEKSEKSWSSSLQKQKKLPLQFSHGSNRTIIWKEKKNRITILI